MSSAKLDYMLLLHLERSQVIRKGELQNNNMRKYGWTEIIHVYFIYINALLLGRVLHSHISLCDDVCFADPWCDTYRGHRWYSILPLS